MAWTTIAAVVVFPCPCHRQATAERRDLREQVGSVQLTRLGRLPLGIVRWHGGRVHDLGAGRHVLGGVAEEGLDPVPAQACGVARLSAVGPGHLGAERPGDEGETTHPGPADADEMKPTPRPVGRSPACRPHPCRSSTTTGMSRVVLRWYSSYGGQDSVISRQSSGFSSGVAVRARAVKRSPRTWTVTSGSATRFRYHEGCSSAPPLEATTTWSSPCFL